MDLQAKLGEIGVRLQKLDGVVAAGVTGGRELPKPGEGDIDLFIYCESIPMPEIRAAAFPEAKINLFQGERWGTGDLIILEGVETFMMYMTTKNAEAEIREILAGRRYKVEEGKFYPTGRVGMYIGMHELFDGGFIAHIKEICAVYPEALARALIGHNLAQLDDTETFQRAVSRKEVLLYHSELEAALDSILQALFALNRTYFPSRKRSLEYIERFTVKPKNCGARLLRIVELGAAGAGIGESYAMLTELIAELRTLEED